MQIVYLKDYQEFTTALAHWSFATWSPYYPQTTRKNQIQEFKMHCHKDRLPLALIALDEKQRLIGMCSLRKTEGICGELTPWLSSLYVLPSHRYQKVGTQLVNEIKRTAKNLGFEKLYLSTFDPTLNPYFGHRGWSLIGQDEINRYSVSIMETNLD